MVSYKNVPFSFFMYSSADPGCLSRITDPNFSIPDPGSASINVSILTSVADPDPGSGIGCLFYPWIRDPGWVESQHPDPGSGMNNPDHIF
jgi:hypothetical protein